MKGESPLFLAKGGRWVIFSFFLISLFSAVASPRATCVSPSPQSHNFHFLVLTFSIELAWDFSLRHLCSRTSTTSFFVPPLFLQPAVMHVPTDIASSFPCLFVSFSSFPGCRIFLQCSPSVRGIPSSFLAFTSRAVALYCTGAPKRE